MTTDRILVVDDDQSVLEVTCHMLSLVEEYEVISASGPSRALEIVGKEPHVDLVISDVEMDEMRGPELFDEITKISPDTACVLMSAFVKEATDLPADVPFVKKPFSKSELFSTVKGVLAESRRARAEVARPRAKSAGLRQRTERLRLELQEANGAAAEAISDSREICGSPGKQKGPTPSGIED